MLSGFKLKAEPLFPEGLPPDKYSPQFVSEFNCVLQKLNTFIAYHSGTGLILQNQLYVQNMHLAVFLLYDNFKKVAYNAFEKLIQAVDMLYQDVPKQERKSILVPVLKQAIMVLGTAIANLDEEKSEKYISDIKRYVRCLNTLGLSGEPESYRVLSRNFLEEAAKKSEFVNFRPYFIQQIAAWDNVREDETALLETVSQDSTSAEYKHLINRFTSH